MMRIKKHNYTELFAFLLFVIVGFFLHFCNYDNSVFALDKYTESFFAQNDIYFYEPCATEESSNSTIKISGNSAEEKVWSGLTSFLSEEQAAGVMGNLSHESGLNPIRRQGDNTSSDIWSDNASSGWALGLAQWDGTRRPTMLNYVKGKDSSLISLFDVSNYESSADDFISKAGHDKANKLYAYEIEFLKSEIDKSYKEVYNISDVREAANWFCETVERPASCASSRADKAQEYYNKYAGKTIVGNGVDSAGSGISSTTLTSSVHDKAWELANQTKEQAMNGPTAAYTAAIKSVGGDTGGGDECARSGESCDMFVATVLKASGVDMDVPWGAVSAQAEWFASHPEIYTEVEGDASDPNTYQPGDIRIRDGHVEIFGEKDGKPYILSASHCDRWAGYQDFFVESGYEYKIYRTDGTPACVSSTSCTQGNMNLNATAVCLAWPLGTDSSKYKCNGKYGSYGCTSGSPTDAFQNAIDTVFPNRGWSACPHVGASCDVGTATVIRYSGVDENFPRGLGDGAGGQRGWAKAHSDIWEVLPFNKNNLQPGDIMYRSGHIAMYVEDVNGVGYTAESGLCSSFFHIREGVSSNFENIFRAKNAKNSTAGIDVKSGNTGSSTGNTSSTTSTTTSGSAEKINELAIQYSWPLEDSEKAVNNPTPEFKEAIDSITSKQGKGQCWGYGKSCVVYVRTVLIKAGVLESNQVVRDVGPTREQLIESGNWEEIEISNPSSEEEYEPGDVIVYLDGAGEEKHIAIYVEIDGKGYLSQASKCDYYGRISKLTGYYSKTVVYRYKVSGDKCDACAGQNDNSGTGLKEGGMTLDEAKSWMEAYAEEASKKKRGSYSFQGALVSDAGCIGGTLNNCVAFSQWFLNKYTSIGPKWGNTVNGDHMVQQLGNTQGLRTGTEPQPYAIFSTGTYNHTGVVLGVTSDSIIIGEAICSGGFVKGEWPGVREWSLDEAKSKKMTYAYTDNIININGL